MTLLTEALSKICPVDAELMAQAQARLDNKTKPIGSLGRLEEFARRMVAITGSVAPDTKKKVVFTFAGDHGVTDEGVSAFPREVTPQMVYNFLRGGAGINVLARHVGAQVRVVDIGVDHDFGDTPGLIVRKVARGTRNFARGPAMTREEAVAALEVGIDLANEAKREGIALVGTGEMGIGNTTPSAAIIAAFSGLPVPAVTHRGTGIGDEALANKVRVIEAGLALNQPDPKDPIDVLAKVGGLEIAGIAGLILGCAANRLPVVVDGFISTAGALVACELNPHVRDYLFAAHQSVEVGHRVMLDRIGAAPILDLQLRLGEGTGGALAMGLIEAGVRILTEMATFEEAGVAEGDY
ncbi:nicotinate-nucleotide--dimethylbenzimidazole phosphoribosyltransferase [Geobacter sulfurreducens]|jgi:nicotinate-nucleotide--dimethylbenzimidazole phosphoribosyltransferase|uniref:Nicotinate-nucleotide--dimethylbenzimidazole phosphoribosyltransferase n=1 Tax=Geobacter sulfurreducens (strain ATCC 51573 / DSM 12127 / PCA) TaxID=243231 RepID=COBT_GEOSL|nr:nicotinate-nucleotide--dimethylbenzimidazole phosphoribosyltransferase [Geobacter sulfurreducens]Q748J3.1 RecName: Full=Nicotinate-nucleotide--dimethylbenzimidazole phosphoribosyltransferase; Short=NN:DBI PRT; AltName: Full=N(1)-alpha-phosphoribosyltransferase [Geobacter sulfurreducens PCA]AAR36401.1 nicotinate-nucleotide--dimethylbenzimidazole phosphoribosyltransferase [Geobacter sulfurreducens PCA]ADI85764.1 nicotinate-nucleotide--dimethylbenzimidazole phosphoribosyltransferase [Geobacter s